MIHYLSQYAGQETYENWYRTGTIVSAEIGADLGQNIGIQMVRPVWKVEEDLSLPSALIWITGGERPNVEAKAVTKVISTATANQDGWIPLGKPLSGNFFRFGVLMADRGEPSLKEFLGLMVRYQQQGRY
jgi:hypothetical protein